VIGLFDSGIGGISVLNEIVRQLPEADCLYVADTAGFPYGRRSQQDIIARSHALTDLLLAKGCRLVVVACNSATGAAIESLRRSFGIPFVGIEPAIKVAREYVARGPIGVLCTDLTSSGAKYRHLMESQGLREQVVTRASPGLAAVIEEGKLRGEELRECVRREVEPLRREGTGCLVLGCTHYAFVRREIEAALGVPVLEPSEAVARRAVRLYVQEKPSMGHGGRTRFATTGPLAATRARAAELLTRPPAAWSEETIRPRPQAVAVD